MVVINSFFLIFSCNALPQTYKTVTTCYSRKLLQTAKSHITGEKGKNGGEKTGKNEVVVGSRPTCSWNRICISLIVGILLLPAVQGGESVSLDFTSLSVSLLNVLGVMKWNIVSSFNKLCYVSGSVLGFGDNRWYGPQNFLELEFTVDLLNRFSASVQSMSWNLLESWKAGYQWSNGKYQKQ